MTDSIDKDAYTEALEADKLRGQLTVATEGAVKHGTDRDWANAWLRKLGAKQITGRSEYRMNVPITGFYGWRTKAGSRAEAAKAFLEQVQRIASQGKITADGSYDNVYDVKFAEPVTESDVIFYAGPEDPEDSTDPVPGLDELKVQIRKMLMEGVSEQSWGYNYARRTLAAMGLDPMPAYSYKNVEVPVSGTATVSLRVFDDASQDDLQKAAASALRRQGAVSVTPQEIGEITAQDEDAEDEVENDPF
jgi:peptidoglycan hydrolase-like protein with peptidoglycan-binding domain